MLNPAISNRFRISADEARQIQGMRDLIAHIAIPDPVTPFGRAINDIGEFLKTKNVTAITDARRRSEDLARIKLLVDEVVAPVESPDELMIKNYKILGLYSNLIKSMLFKFAHGSKLYSILKNSQEFFSASLGREIADRQKKVGKLELINSLNGAIADRRKELGQLGAIVDLSQEISELDQTVTHRRMTIGTLNHEIGTLNQKITAKVAVMDGLNVQIQEKQNSVNQLDQILREGLARIDRETKERLAELDRRVFEKLQKIEEKKQELARVEELLERNELVAALTCPINLKIMKDPVVLPESGRAYERSEIVKWYLTNHDVNGDFLDPITQIKVHGDPSRLPPCYTLRSIIEAKGRRYPSVSVPPPPPATASPSSISSSDPAIVRISEIGGRNADGSTAAPSAPLSRAATSTLFAAIPASAAPSAALMRPAIAPESHTAPPILRGPAAASGALNVRL